MTGPRHAFRQQAGQRAEEAARRYLQARGWAILACNFRRRSGEIDLVAKDPQGTVVFVEVRARRAWGGEPGLVRAAASVDRQKQARIIRAARAVYAGRPDLARLPARFDVVTVELSAAGEPGAVRHVPAAFDLNG